MQGKHSLHPFDRATSGHFQAKNPFQRNRLNTASNERHDEFCNCGAKFTHSGHVIKDLIYALLDPQPEPCGQHLALLELASWRTASSRTMDQGLTSANRERPGFDQELAALREGNAPVVSRLNRPAPSVPDARAIAGELRKRCETRSRRSSP